MLTTLRSTDEVFRLRAVETTDSVGDKVRSWASPARARIPNEALESVSGTATDGTVIELDSERRLLIVGAYDLTSLDRIEADGEVWRVNGKPAVKRGLMLGTHTVAKLKRHEAR